MSEAINLDTIGIEGALKSASTANLVAGGVGAAAGILGQFMASKSQKAANAQNIELAREQMAFQERMSSTAHQREMNDLRLAGLNPALTATGGSGSSTPAGASAEVKPIVSENALSSIASNARSIASFEADMQQKELNLDQTRAQTSNIDAKTNTEVTQALLNRRNAAKTYNEQAHLDSLISLNDAKEKTEATTQALQQSQKLLATTNAANVSLDTARGSTRLPYEQQKGKFDSEYAPITLSADAILERSGQVVDQLSNAVDMFKPKFKIEHTNTNPYRRGR